MQNVIPIEVFFWYASLVVKVILLWRLFALGLAQRYKALWLALIISCIRTLVLLPIPVRSLAYTLTYFFTQPLLLLLYVLVALEIYGQVFESYQGISFLGRTFLGGTIAVSVVVSLLMHVSEFDFTREPFKILRFYLLGESSLFSILLLFLLGLTAFLFWYPVPLRKNLLHYNLVFSVFFAAMSAGVHLRNFDPNGMGARFGSALRMGVETACLLAWVFLFRKEWEEQSTGISFSVTKAHQARVLQQLESMNRAILRVKKSS